MGDAAPADPERFKEASDWFRTKLAVTRDEWDAMRTEARRQAFTIAGTQQLDVVQKVMESLQSAIDKGTPIDEWRAAIAKSLGEKFTTDNATNLTTAFINAHQTAYNTGRWYQMQDPAVTGALPYLRWDTVLDGHQTVICDACANTTLPHDSPWWLTHWPPMHPRCRSTVRALSERMAKRGDGITEEPPRPTIKGDWGLAPPLRTGWEPNLNKYEPHAAREYTRKQQSMLGRERRRFRKAAPPEPPSTRLGTVGDKVFGRKISDRELDELLGLKAKLPAGYTLSIASVDESAKRGAVRVVGAIRNASGELVGNLAREFTAAADGGAVVKHHIFFVNEAQQNLGIGKAVFNAQIDAYVKTGLVKDVALDAIDSGRYVWTKAGFEWGAEDKPALLGNLRDKLLTKVSPEAADAILSNIKTPFDVSRVVVDGDRIGKDLLMNYPSDVVSMSQAPGKIKPL